MRTLLVTGAAGYLGSELVRRAAEAGLDVAGTYRTRPPSEALTAGAHRLDVRDEDAIRAVLDETRPDAVVHTAYLQDGPEAWSVTVDGAAIVAQAAASAGARLVHMSTDVLFDRDGGPPLDEREAPNPVTDYARAKAAAEREVAAAHPAALVVRTSLIYGGAERSHHERVAIEAAEGRREMTFFTDELRSPVAVGDLADALVELVGLDVAGPLHVAGADAVSRYELACLVARANGLSAGRLAAGTIAAAGLARPRNCALDSGRARELLRTRLRGVREVLSTA